LPRPNIDAVELLFRFHLLHTMRTRTLFQAENVPVDLLSDVRIELAKIPLGSGSDLNAVGQNSVSKFPHEVTKRNGPLLFGLLQGGTGVFEVDSVHFLTGQAFQEAEVIHGNDGGQVLPAAGDNGPLLAVGGAVYDFRKLLPRFRDIEASHGDVLFVRLVRVSYQYRPGMAGIASGAPVWTASRHKYGTATISSRGLLPRGRPSGRGRNGLMGLTG